MSSERFSKPDPRIPVPAGPIPRAPERAARRPLELSVDGRDVRAPEGSTLLEAIRLAGVETPTLCYLDGLTPVNACRVCVVELEGSRALVPACSRKIEAGMAVRTDSERVKLSRRMVLEFLTSSVDVSTAPELAAYMKQYDARPDRYGRPTPTSGSEAPAAGSLALAERDRAEPGHHEKLAPGQAATVLQPAKIDNELYVRDYSKCILCYKCVEACGVDAQNTFAISVAGRGFDARISTEYAAPLPESACVYCGNCIPVCPTGALMVTTEYEMRKQATWDEPRQSVSDTVCAYCGVGCNLRVHVQDRRIVKVTSPRDHDVTGGHLCVKGRFGWKFAEPDED